MREFTHKKVIVNRLVLVSVNDPSNLRSLVKRLKDWRSERAKGDTEGKQKTSSIMKEVSIYKGRGE